MLKTLLVSSLLTLVFGVHKLHKHSGTSLAEPTKPEIDNSIGGAPPPKAVTPKAVKVDVGHTTNNGGTVSEHGYDNAMLYGGILFLCCLIFIVVGVVVTKLWNKKALAPSVCLHGHASEAIYVCG